MTELIALGVVVYLLMKLQAMSEKLTLMMSKVDSLQYSLNDLLQTNYPQKQTSYKPQIQEPIKQEIKRSPVKMMKLESKPIDKSPKREPKDRSSGKSLEDFLVGNLLLNISVIAFVLGIGFFLKYSIDQNWIPIWGRMFIGVGVSLGMIVVAIKIGDKHPKLFSEVLFGGAIAILYLSVYAGFALEGFAFLSPNVALVSMILITIFAGFISLLFDSLTTAVFGLIGGFATPYLIGSGAQNVEALMIYLLILNSGVLYTAFSKRWSLLNILAFALTMLIELSISEFWQDSFLFLQGMFFLIFIIYSIVPFIHQIREKNIKLQTPLTVLFGANILLYLLASAKLFLSQGFEFKQFAIITIITALYLFYYAFRLKKEGEYASNLYSLIVAKALGLLLLTPAIMLDGRALSATWAVEATILLYISYKTQEKNHIYFAMLGFALAFARYLGVDLVDAYNSLDVEMYAKAVMKQSFVAAIMIGTFVYASTLPIAKNLKDIEKEFNFKKILLLTSAVMLFLFLNIEVINWAKLFLPKAKNISVTLLWVIFGIGGFLYALKKEIKEGKNIAIGLIMLAVVKAFFIDLANSDSLYRIVLFILVGVLLFVLAYYYKRDENLEKL